MAGLVASIHSFPMRALSVMRFRVVPPGGRKNDIYGGNPYGTFELVVSQIFCIPCSLDFFVAKIIVLPEFSHRRNS